MANDDRTLCDCRGTGKTHQRGSYALCEHHDRITEARDAAFQSWILELAYVPPHMLSYREAFEAGYEAAIRTASDELVALLADASVFIRQHQPSCGLAGNIDAALARWTTSPPVSG